MPPLKRKPWVPVLFWYHPTIWPASLMPFAKVPVLAKGSLRVMYMPPLKRKPWKLASWYCPTIWPALLMPNASVVPVAKGSSRVV